MAELAVRVASAAGRWAAIATELRAKRNEEGDERFCHGLLRRTGYLTPIEVVHTIRRWR